MKKQSSKKNVHDILAEKHDCYVLITCDDNDNNGQMFVEMSYQGDAALASYLLEGGQTYINEHIEEEGEYISK